MVARRRPSVVIIDDAPDLRLLLRTTLEAGGFDVEAGDGRTSIEAACALPPDVILLDLTMSVMDGLEALPVLRAACPDTRIIVLSGLGTAQATRQALAAGADGHLPKRAPHHEVLAYVREVVAGRATGSPTGHAGAVPDTMRGSAYGVLELVDEPIYRVISADDVAVELVGNPCRPGTPLFSAAPELAGSVTLGRPGDGAPFEVVLRGRPVVAVLSHADTSVLLFVAAARLG